MGAVHLVFGWILIIWALVLIVADLIAPAAPVKRSAFIFQCVLAIWLITVWVSFPRL